MKFVIILSLIAVTLAKEFDMKLDENGEKFTEKVKVDLAGKTEEIEVPQHGNRAAINVLHDFNVGYSAIKWKAAKVCYISVISNEQTPAQLERSMEKSHAKFPTDSYMVHNNKFVRLYNMSDAEVGPKIAAHCAGYDMIFTMAFKKDSDVLKVMKSPSTKTKRFTIQRFAACNFGATNLQLNCQNKPIKIACELLPNPGIACVYNVVCNYRSNHLWNCNGKHNYHLPFCCRLFC